METKRLRTLQQPSVVQALLESLLTSLNHPPPGATRIVDRSELPMALQRLAIRSSKNGGAWVAWTLLGDILVCSAELSLDLARERGQPTLEVMIYDENGRIRRWGIWAQAASGKWQPHSQ